LLEEADIYVINPEGIEWLIFGGRKVKLLMLVGGRSSALTHSALTSLLSSSTPEEFASKLSSLYLDILRDVGASQAHPLPTVSLIFSANAYVMDLGNALGRFITHYRLNYFYNPDGMGWKWVPREGAEERFMPSLNPSRFAWMLMTILQLPEINDVVQRLDLPADARKIYDALEDDLVAKIEERTVTAANAATAGGKLWQVCNGGLYVDNDVASDHWRQEANDS
jgi:hypothetical protein